jgi:uncharacterized protein with FMN-binding domain
LIIAGAGAFIYINGRLKVLSTTVVEVIDLGAVADGVYTGGYSSFPVSAKVEVRVLDHRITQIRLLEHVNGKGGAAQAIPSFVFDAQSLKVETVSGATYSSKVILLAIADALKKGLQ